MNPDPFAALGLPARPALSDQQVPAAPRAPPAPAPPRSRGGAPVPGGRAPTPRARGGPGRRVRPDLVVRADRTQGPGRAAGTVRRESAAGNGGVARGPDQGQAPLADAPA